MMILPTMRGVLGRAYVPPTLAYDGSYLITITNNGTATPTIRTGTNSNLEHGYATRVITGLVYWEVVIKCGIPIFGIAQSTTSFASYGGYGATTTKGSIALYSYTGTISRDGAGVTPNDAQLTRAVDKRIGIAVDTAAKTIAFYAENTLQQSVSINTTKLNAGPLYPHTGGQYGYPMSGETCGDDSSALQFCFGPMGCTYTPPSGFAYY